LKGNYFDNFLKKVDILSEKVKCFLQLIGLSGLEAVKAKYLIFSHVKPELLESEEYKEKKYLSEKYFVILPVISRRDKIWDYCFGK
jgi:hypothetical protein